jgi:hypothetical protein
MRSEPTKSPQACQQETAASLEAEAAFLGAVLVDNSFLEVGRSQLAVADFSSERHGVIYRAMLEVADEKKPVDLVILHQHLVDTSQGHRVSAAELSALSVGVPADRASVAEYIKIIKRLSQERTSRRDFYDVGQAAAEGAPLVEVAERAAAVLDKAKPRVRGPTPGEYPVIPETAWYGITKIYRAAVGNSTEGSDNFHLTCFLVVVGALLGRSVFAHMGRKVFGNLYAVLVGRAGAARKDTCIDLALDFAQDVDQELYVSYSVDSREGMIEGMVQRKKERAEAKLFGTLRTVITLSEFRALIEKAQQKATASIIPELAKGYDCRRPLQVNTRNARLSIDDYILAFLCGTAPGWMQTLSLTDLQGGFGRRVMWIPGDPKPAMPEPPAPESSILNPLKVEVREILDYWQARGTTCLGFSPAARKLWWEFYTHHHKRCQVDDELVAALSESDHSTARKLALIYAATDRNETIEESHLSAAIAFLGFLYDVRGKLFYEHGMAPSAQLEQMVMRKLSQWRDDGHYPVVYGNLSNAFWRYGRENVERAVLALTKGEQIFIRPLGRKRVVTLVE